MTFFQGVKIIIDGLWNFLNIPINIDGIKITFWQMTLFPLIVAAIMNMVFPRGSGGGGYRNKPTKEDKE